MTEFVSCVLILMIAIPVTAYLTTKLARFAYLKATQLFNETSNPPQEKCNGDQA